MKRGIYFYIVPFLLMVVTIVFSFRIVTDYKKQLKFLQENCQNSISAYTAGHKLLSERVLLHSSVSAPVVLDTDETLMTVQGKKVTFKKVVSKKKYSLILKLSKRYCPDCIEREINSLTAFTKHKAENISAILLVDSYTPKEIMILKNQINFSFPVYIAPPTFLKALKAERLNVPYLFLTNPSGVARMPFIPDKGLPALTNEYHQRIITLSENNVSLE